MADSVYTHNATYPAQSAIRMQMLSDLVELRYKIKAVMKGVRQSHTWVIINVGHHPKGIRTFEVARNTDTNYYCTLARVTRAMRDGFIIKTGNMYTLSERGQIVYNTISEATLKDSKIAVRIVSEHAHKLNNTHAK